MQSYAQNSGRRRRNRRRTIQTTIESIEIARSHDRRCEIMEIRNTNFLTLNGSAGMNMHLIPTR